MKNQNNQNYYQNNGDYGRRYRKEKTVSPYDNYDVEEPVPRQRQSDITAYEAEQIRRRQQYNQYNAQRRQQAVQRGYDYRNVPEGYGDNYDGRYHDPRYDRQRYDDRYVDYREPRAAKPKKRTSGALIAVRVMAIILLIAGIGIVGWKLYNYYIAEKAHNALMSKELYELNAANSDCFGWLEIEGTDIAYPVMYTPYEPEKYLHMNFDQEYSESGELFADASCDLNGYHYLIYGHHMYNGSMFGSLPNYGEEDYYNSHRTIRFNTLNETGEYEIFAVFYSQVYDESDDVFKYYNLANLNDEGTYNYYVSNVKAMSIYDTGITPVYGEKILTLSTCNYHTEDGRFVVCARKVQ